MALEALQAVEYAVSVTAQKWCHVGTTAKCNICMNRHCMYNADEVREVDICTRCVHYVQRREGNQLSTCCWLYI